MRNFLIQYKWITFGQFLYSTPRLNHLYILLISSTSFFSATTAQLICPKRSWGHPSRWWGILSSSSDKLAAIIGPTNSTEQQTTLSFTWSWAQSQEDTNRPLQHLRTTTSHLDNIDREVAEFIYACNLPFSVVEHPAFLAMVTALQPGYKPPTGKAVGGKFLDETHKRLQEDMKKQLDGKTVTIQQDAWSDVHNEPVIATTLVSNEKPFFLDAVGTGTMPKTANKCKDLLKQSIAKAEDNYGFKVRTVVTDNAKNMERIGEALKEEDPDLVTYGCLAHWLNLLGQDITPADVMEHVVDINKYFRNHHIPGALLGAYEGIPQLPGDTQWKSQLSCLQSYLTNRPYIITISQEHADDIDSQIAQKVLNVGIFRIVRNLVSQLQPVTMALDKAQRDNCNLADACDIFLSLPLGACAPATPHKAEQTFRTGYQALPPLGLYATSKISRNRTVPTTSGGCQELADQSWPLLPTDGHRVPGGNRGIFRDILHTCSLRDESQYLVGCAERLDRVTRRIPDPDAATSHCPS